MAFQPVPGGIEAVLEFQMPDTTRVVNVLHVRYTGTGSIGNSELELVADPLNDWVIGNWKGIASNQAGCVGFTLRSLETQVAPTITFTYGAPQMGTVASGAMPNNVTIAIKLLTGLTGRTARGRLYHVGLAENQVLGNFLTGTLVSTIQPAYDALRTRIAAVSDLSLAVLSRVENKVVRPAGVMYEVIQVALGDTRIDTQRRRLPRLSGQG